MNGELHNVFMYWVLITVGIWSPGICSWLFFCRILTKLLSLNFCAHLLNRENKRPWNPFYASMSLRQSSILISIEEDFALI